MSTVSLSGEIEIQFDGNVFVRNDNFEEVNPARVVRFHADGRVTAVL